MRGFRIQQAAMAWTQSQFEKKKQNKRSLKWFRTTLKSNFYHSFNVVPYNIMRLKHILIYAQLSFSAFNDTEYLCSNTDCLFCIDFSSVYVSSSNRE
jgi:hypothetical protein